MAEGAQLTAIEAITMVIIRVLAAYWFFTTMAGYIPFAFALGDEIWFHAYYISLICVSGTLWFLARRIAEWVLPADAVGEADMTSIGAQNLLAIGTFLIGLFYFLNTFPTAIQNTLIYFGASPPVGWDGVGRLLGPWVLSVVALLIMFRADEISRFFLG